MRKPGEKYCPSNGTEGCAFTDHFCANCIHEKFMHTQKDGDKQCDILNRTILCSVSDPGYPEEWTYDEHGNPTCTAWMKWDWGNDDDDHGLNEPPPEIPEDPNQLCLPFIFDEIGVPEIREEVM